MGRDRTTCTGTANSRQIIQRDIYEKEAYFWLHWPTAVRLFCEISFHQIKCAVLYVTSKLVLYVSACLQFAMRAYKWFYLWMTFAVIHNMHNNAP